MRSPAQEIERTLKDGRIVSVRVYGCQVPSEPGFPSELIGFKARVFCGCGGKCGPDCEKMCKKPKELFQKDLPTEWDRIEWAAKDALCEATVDEYCEREAV